HTSTTGCSPWGATPHRWGESAKCIAPAVEAGNRAAKRGENRAPLRPQRGVHGSRAAMSSPRTHVGAVVITYRGRGGVAGGRPRPATPAQNGTGSGDQRTYCRLAIHPSPTRRIVRLYGCRARASGTW